MNVNTHFHTIVTEGGNDKNCNWKNVNYFDYRILRFKWRDLAVNIISKHVEMSEDNQMIFEMIDVTYRNGFNVRREKGGIPKKQLIGYIARYVRHPPISNQRIIDYNGKGVTIICKNPKRFVTMTVEEFTEYVDELKLIATAAIEAKVSEANESDISDEDNSDSADGTDTASLSALNVETDSENIRNSFKAAFENVAKNMREKAGIEE